MQYVEKRAHPRRRVRIPIMCWETGGGKASGRGMEVISKDLSAGGVAFFSSRIYPVETVLWIEVHLPGRKNPVKVSIKVARVEAVLHKEEYLIGAAFMDLTTEDRLFISSSLEKMNLYTLLDEVVNAGASDLHLTVGRPPMVRVDGRILPMAAGMIEDGQIAAMIYPLLTPFQIETFEKKKELDFAFSPNLGSRFRVNLHFQKGFLETALRTIPARTKTFQELGLPVETMEHFCKEKSGLILIAGTTGAGKTTTMASMVDFINRTQERVVITVEDPIEYTLQSQKCIVKQRELGSDTLSYAEALKRTLRQDPDVIVVGELLDGECLSAAMRAAETGHLVITTVHAPDTIQAIERLINFFPPEHATSICQQVASCMIGILFQLLLPGEGGNLILATELLVNNNAIKNLIREGRYNQIRSILQTGRAQGMYTLKTCLAELYDKGLISQSTLQEYAKQD